MRYPGGKAGAGVYQKIINQIPPHDTYIETHLGGGAILRYKLPARRQIGLDIDREVIAAWQQESPSGVELVCADAVEFLQQFEFTGNEFVYADPPYLMETRRGGPIYRHEYTRAQHLALLSCLKSLPCKVMISGYWSELYTQELADWRTISFQAVTRGGRLATEWLWMNYGEPTALHDYRYLGESFRDRERIKRKKQRWVRKIESMPHLERMALMGAMEEAAASPNLAIGSYRHKERCQLTST